jgi:hypothetical protein
MGLRALLALCATPLVAGFGGLTYLRSIEDIEELHAPSVDTEGVKIDGVYDGLLHTHLSPLDAMAAPVNGVDKKIGTVYEFKHIPAGPVATINLYEGHFPTPPPPSPASAPGEPAGDGGRVHGGGGRVLLRRRRVRYLRLRLLESVKMNVSALRTEH